MTYNFNPGVQTSDDMIMARKQFLVEDIDTRVINYMDFLPAVNVKNFAGLDTRFRFPKEDILPAYKIEEGQTTEFQKSGWYEGSMSLDMYRTQVAISDQARERGDEELQWMTAKDNAAQGIAQARDAEILQALYDHAGVSESAGAHWDAESNNVIGDIADAMEQVFTATLTNISASEIANLKIFYPAKLFMHVQNKPELWANSGTSAGNQGYLIPNSNQTEWLQGKGIQFVPTHRLNGQTVALGVMSLSLIHI